MFEFRVEATDGRARAGRLITEHAEIETPVFMPVGTRASVKGLSPRDITELGADIILANTYHLLLRPGVELIEELGGLHRFMAYPGAILTDSGGYEVFSLAALRRISDDGVTFRSHLDGSPLQLTPERVVAAQHALGSDIIMPLDVCPPFPAEPSELREAVRLTSAWAERSLAAHGGRPGQALLRIVQGGLDIKLRNEAARRLIELGFSGYALGGFSVGEPLAAMLKAIAGSTAALPEDRPRYLMGSGMPADILGAVAEGVDMFDAVIPTRHARNGQAFTSEGRLNLRNRRFRHDSGPLDVDCKCYTCTSFSRAYLRHLVSVGELLGAVLLTRHNVAFFLDMMRELRQSILHHRFQAFRASRAG